MLFVSLQVIVQALTDPLLSCFFIHPKGVRADAIERHKGSKLYPGVPFGYPAGFINAA